MSRSRRSSCRMRVPCSTRTDFDTSLPLGWLRPRSPAGSCSPTTSPGVPRENRDGSEPADELGLRDLDGPPSTAAPHTPPSSTVEKVLHDLWSDVLQRDGFGIKDRFLDAGGDSLLAMRLLSRVSDTLDLDISIIDFFDSPTVADQAVLIEELLLA